METVISNTLVKNYDPTRTTVLRNAFAQDMKRRFTELVVTVRKAVDTEDCFNLRNDNIQTHQMTTPGAEAFNFERSAAKLEAFMKWLQEQVDRGILDIRAYQQVGSGVYNAWTNLYIFDSYKRGIIRARNELKKAGLNIPSIEDSGGINAIMELPFHVDRVGLLFTRVYNDLKGITAAMDMQISRVLAQGMADGDGAALLARKLVATINGTGMGDLAIKDTLGRFIPAMNRAVLLARTEIIRAHHIATIQEYRNWGLEGVVVKGEWSTAGDDRVCSLCSAMEGRIFTLDEIEPMIPLHPQCFIDPQIPIYTSEGWKPIGKIKIGDLVLTHKRRFRKVYALPRSKAIINKTEVTTFKFKGDLKLSMTSNHPVLVTTKEGTVSRWGEVGKCKEGSYLSLLGNECKRCGKSIPYFRKYCSRTCLSLDITDKQWANPEHRKLVSRKNRISNLKQYASGERDRFAVTKKANERVREMVKEGTFVEWMDEAFFDKIRQVTNTPEMRKKSSERMLKNNPMQDPIVVAKAQKSMKRHLLENPEKRINVRMAKYRKSGNKTWIEERMGLLLDKLGIEYVFQYPILRYNVDFAIPELMIAIECDGGQWHQDKEKEQIRQERLEYEGWTVLHYTGAKINQCLPEIEKELARVLCNHLGEFQLASWPIEKITKWTMSRAMPLYNLSVEEDESYIAKGVVVHNCRCIALPWIEELKKYY